MLSKNRYELIDAYDSMTDSQLNAIVARIWGWEIHSKREADGHLIWELSLDGIVFRSALAIMLPSNSDIFEEMVIGMKGFPAYDVNVALRLWHGKKHFYLTANRDGWKAVLQRNRWFHVIAMAQSEKPARALTICWLRLHDIQLSHV